MADQADVWAACKCRESYHDAYWLVLSCFCLSKTHLCAAEAAFEADWLAAADQPEACLEASPADAEAFMAAATRSLYNQGLRLGPTMLQQWCAQAM